MPPGTFIFLKSASVTDWVGRFSFIVRRVMGNAILLQPDSFVLIV